MITIGLTGWGDHPDLYREGVASRDKLKEYSAHFPVVEVDTAFYAIPSMKNVQKWVEDTPPTFSFVFKAYQGMTGHLRGENPYATEEEMYETYIQSLQPAIEANKLKAILFQYPPWFDCTREHVEQLRYVKQKMQGLPVALEFRHQSWFAGEMREKTLRFLEKEGWIYSICDEPQAGLGSVPTVLHPTDDQLTIVRFHGRNREGWNNRGFTNWRDVRYLYRYSDEELMEWTHHINDLLSKTKEVCLLFNNNSGGDAAANAKRMMQLLDIEYQGLSPRQLDLFDL